MEYTKYERSRVLSARSFQLSMGAPPLIKVSKGIIDPLTIARIEFEKDLIPITVVRTLPEKVE